MKKAHLTSCCLLFCLFSFPSFGQLLTPTFGIKAGPNLRTAFISGADKDPDQSAAFTIGFQLGGLIEIHQSDELKIQGGLSIISKGYKLKDQFLDDFEKFSVTYIQVPLNLFFKLGTVWVGGGPYFALAVDGTRDYYGKEPLFIGTTDDDDWSPFDIGVGLRGHKRVGVIDVGADIEMGMADCYPKGSRADYDYHIKNFSINLFAAYMFEK